MEGLHLVSTVAQPNQSARAWAAARAIGLVALVAVLVRRVEWEAVATSWRGMSASAGVGIIAAVVAAMGLRAWKWTIQVRAMGLRRAPAAGVVRGFLIGALLGAVTPLRAGEVVRVASATAGEPPGEARRLATAAVLLEKGYELLVVLATLAVGAALVGMSLETCLFILIATLAVGWLALGPAGARRGRLLGAMAAAKRCLTRGDRARLLGLTAAAHGLNLAAGLLIYRAFGEIGVGDYVVRIPLITLINTIPITVGGFGLRELTAMELFGRIGYPAAGAAVAAAGLFFAANVLPALLLLPPATILAARRESE